MRCSHLSTQCGRVGGSSGEQYFPGGDNISQRVTISPRVLFTFFSKGFLCLKNQKTFHGKVPKCPLESRTVARERGLWGWNNSGASVTHLWAFLSHTLNSRGRALPTGARGLAQGCRVQENFLPKAGSFISEECNRRRKGKDHFGSCFPKGFWEILCIQDTCVLKHLAQVSQILQEEAGQNLSHILSSRSLVSTQ